MYFNITNTSIITKKFNKFQKNVFFIYNLKIKLIIN